MSQAVLECCCCAQLLAVDPAHYVKLQSFITRHHCNRRGRAVSFKLHLQHEELSFAVVTPEDK